MNAPPGKLHPAGITEPVGGLLPGVRPLGRRRLQCYLALVVGDIAMLFSGFAAAGYLYLGAAGLGRAVELTQLVLPVYLTFALYNSAYSLAALKQTWHGIRKALGALALAVAAVVFIAFYTKSSDEVSRLGFSLGFVLTALLVCWLRLQMRAFVAWRCGSRVTNELIIHDGGPDLTLPLAWHISAPEMGIMPSLDDPSALHRIGMLLRDIDLVVVSCSPERRALWARILKSANIEGEVIDEAVGELDAQGARIAGGVGLLRVSAGPLGLRARAAKRLFDLTIAGAGLLILAPLLMAIALAIKLEDGGPVIFAQRRVGRGNRFFAMYKFRSMKSGQVDPEGTRSTAREDARVTRVGRFIRRTSLDELPQLINVLTGEMSLVGPRPHALGSQAGNKLFWEIDRRYWQRHALKPGMTGLAQVRGWRGATGKASDLESRLNADLEYLYGWSLRRDLAILAATMRVLVHDRAY